MSFFLAFWEKQNKHQGRKNKQNLKDYQVAEPYQDVGFVRFLKPQRNFSANTGKYRQR